MCLVVLLMATLRMETQPAVDLGHDQQSLRGGTCWKGMVEEMDGDGYREKSKDSPESWFESYIPIRKTHILPSFFCAFCLFNHNTPQVFPQLFCKETKLPHFF